MGETGETLYVTRELDSNALREELMKIKSMGINSIAVALAHSYTFKDHEISVGKIAQEIGNQLKQNMTGCS